MKRYGPSRREFLKASAVAGIGFWIGGSAPAASTSPNEQIRFACVGVGGKGQSDTKDASRSGDVVAICDVDDDALGKAGQAYQTAKRFHDWREMLDEMGDNFDAVTVSIPDHSHAVVAAAAMRLGKHAFVQKPLTHYLWEARKLGEIAAEQKVVTQMGNQYTASTNLRKAAAMIQAGVLGAVSEVYCWTNRPIWPQGVERADEETPPRQLHWKLFLGPAPYRPYAKNYHPFNWRGWWDFGTGSLGDMACHTMNLPYMALDLRDPISVQAETTGHNRDSYPSKSKVTYEFAATDARPAVKLHWYDAKQRPDRELLSGNRVAIPDTKPPEEKKGGKDAKNEGKDEKEKADKDNAPSFSDTGALFIGEKGKLYAPGDYAEQQIDLIGAEPMDVSFTKSPGHFAEFTQAIHGKGTPMSNFPNYAVPLTETVLLGNLAIWAASEANTPGKKLEWDAKNLQVKNADELGHMIKPEYRNGYSL